MKLLGTIISWALCAAMLLAGGWLAMMQFDPFYSGNTFVGAAVAVATLVFVLVTAPPTARRVGLDVWWKVLPAQIAVLAALYFAVSLTGPMF